MKALMERWRRTIREIEDEAELVIQVHDEEDEEEEVEFEAGDEVSVEKVDEWKLEDDDEYESRKKAKRDKMMMKPDRKSWNAGYDQLSSLAAGVAQEAKKPRKKQCHAYNPSHDDDGKFTDPEKQKGSSSMKAPDGSSPEDCTGGQARRMKANRSTQSTKRPCGREGKYRCKDGTEKWEEGKLMDEDQMTIDSAYLSGIIRRELMAVLKQQSQTRGCSFQELIRAMSLWTAAEKGKGPNDKD